MAKVRFAGKSTKAKPRGKAAKTKTGKSSNKRGNNAWVSYVGREAAPF